tara:strand:+ start:1425 stop:1607 length:183 start_codon:yes stop_codon:yes gene_type:complete
MDTQQEDKVLDTIERGLLQYPAFDDYESDESDDCESDEELTPMDIERERLLSELMRGAYE